MNDAPGPARPMIGFGQVRHTRLKPAHHAFAYPNCFWLLPLRALARVPVAEVRRNARGWLSFHDADHGDGRADALRGACDDGGLASKLAHDLSHSSAP